MAIQSANIIDDEDELLAVVQAAGDLSPDGSYALAQSFAGERQSVDENTCSASFVIVTNESMNRNGNGHILRKNDYGQGLMTKMHSRNPVVLFDHGLERSLPVALASSPNQECLKRMAKGRQDVARMQEQGLSAATIDAAVADYEQQLIQAYTQGCDLGSYSVVVGDEQATSKAWFNQSDPFSMQLFDMVAQGFVRMASIGFQARKALPLMPDEPRSQRCQGVVDFQRSRAGYRFVETELHEWSVVTVGADRGAFRQCVDRGRVGQEKLTPTMKRYLQRIVELEQEKQSSVTVTVPVDVATIASPIEQAPTPVVTETTQRVSVPVITQADVKPKFDPFAVLNKIKRFQNRQRIAKKIIDAALAK